MGEKQDPPQKPQVPANEAPKQEPMKPLPPEVIMIKGSYTGTKYLGPPLSEPPPKVTEPPDKSS